MYPPAPHLCSAQAAYEAEFERDKLANAQSHRAFLVEQRNDERRYAIEHANAMRAPTAHADAFTRAPLKYDHQHVLDDMAANGGSGSAAIGRGGFSEHDNQDQDADGSSSSTSVMGMPRGSGGNHASHSRQMHGIADLPPPPPPPHEHEDAEGDGEFEDGDDEYDPAEDEDDDEYDEEDDEEDEDDGDDGGTDGGDDELALMAYGAASPDAQRPDIARIEISRADPRLRFWAKCANPTTFYSPPPPPPPPPVSASTVKAASAAATSGAPVFSVSLAGAAADASFAGDLPLPPPPPPPPADEDAESRRVARGIAAAALLLGGPAMPASATASAKAAAASRVDASLPLPPPPPPHEPEPQSASASASAASSLPPPPPPPIAHRPRSHPNQVTESLIDAPAYKVIASLLPPPPLAAPCYPAMSCPSPPRHPAPSPTAASSASPSSSAAAMAAAAAAAAPPLISRALLSFDLRVLYEPGRTGYEPTAHFPIEADALIAGRYQILSMLGSAAFSGTGRGGGVEGRKHSGSRWECRRGQCSEMIGHTERKNLAKFCFENHHELFQLIHMRIFRVDVKLHIHSLCAHSSLTPLLLTDISTLSHSHQTRSSVSTLCRSATCASRSSSGTRTFSWASTRSNCCAF